MPPGRGGGECGGRGRLRPKGVIFFRLEVYNQGFQEMKYRKGLGKLSFRY